MKNVRFYKPVGNVCRLLNRVMPKENDKKTPQIVE
jgi:hypothetical protein